MASRCASCFREGCRWGSWGVEAGGRVQQSSFGTLARSATRAPLHASAVAETAMLPRGASSDPSLGTFARSATRAPLHASAVAEAAMLPRRRVVRPDARNVRTFRYARFVARVSGSGSSDGKSKNQNSRASSSPNPSRSGPPSPTADSRRRRPTSRRAEIRPSAPLNSTPSAPRERDRCRGQTRGSSPIRLSSKCRG